MSQKKVIFIGGTAYSGSTFFDMTLANDPAGFSCGEVYALFNPFRSHHLNPLCGCGDPNCEIWPAALSNGPEKLYETIFELHPNVEFIVDSSKDPFWIGEQLHNLQKTNIAAKNIVIWKTPLEFAHSTKKRNQLATWERSWVNYFRLYLTLVNEWRAIPYADYAQDPLVLKDVCRYLEIPYFEGKEAYWHKKHHLLFGNDSARVHLGDQEQVNGYEGRAKPPQLQTIYYEPVDDAELEALVTSRLEASAYMQDLVDLLQAYDLRFDELTVSDVPALKMSKFDVGLRQLKLFLNNRTWQMRNKN
ncbi:MAG: hypothetical protein ACK2T1_08405 [Candidatus Promineifilaceae bacterium]|jgi:hypothetical protein